MSHDVVEAVFAKVLPSRFVHERLAVVWHAGEPLAVPIEWYDAAFARAEAHRPPCLQLDHVFQSNGMLVTEAWAEFFRRTGAKISISVDGPAWLHDQHRRRRNGAGTHAETMRGLRLLQRAGLHPATITVLTRPSLDHPDALFEFYRDAGITEIAFNVEELEGAHHSSSMSGVSAVEAYRRFMGGFLERMHREPGLFRLREWSNAVDVLRFGVAEGTNQEAEPARILGVAQDGSVSTFSPELLGLRDGRYDDFLFGNIVVDDIESIVYRILASRLRDDIAAGLANCRRTCGWYAWCGGGSPSNKLFETGDFRTTTTDYCRLTRQTLLETVLSVAERELRHDA